MSTIRSLLALQLLAAASVARAQAPAAAPAPAPTPAAAATAGDNDPDWLAVKQAYVHPTPRPSGPGTEPAQAAWGFVFVKNLVVAGEAYYERHPTDPRRWEAASMMANIFWSWNGSLKTDAERQAVDPVMDAATRAAWAAKLDRIVADSRTAKDVPPHIRVYFESHGIVVAMQAAAKQKSDAPWAGLRAQIDALAAQFPAQRDVAQLAVKFVRLRAGDDTAAQETVLKTFADSPNAATRRMVEVELKHRQLLSQPITIAFTATDGRPVDLAKLRGKVVLVDFWATWCGPCKAELPNVVATYKKYHDRGFEVIGISLENAKLLPADTPEQKTTKLAEATKALADFTAGHGMPWPQYFDGKWWKNDISTRFAIDAIPAMFLIDQNGKIVSTNARGAALEAKVKQLLKI